MPYLFYGENTFLIKEKVDKWIERFSNQFGDLNISFLEGANLTFENYLIAISSMPFLGAKRLIVIKNFLLNCKEELIRKNILLSLKKIPETSVVLFVEQGIPDMRTSLFKALNEPNSSYKLDSITPYKLGAWIQDRAKEEGVEIDPEARTKLSVFVGVDLWRMKNEIKKLALFARSQERNIILPNDIEAMVQAENSTNVFQFVDSAARGDSKKALESLKNLTDAGEDEFYIFSMIVYQFRNLFSIFELRSVGLTDQNIAKEAKLHPFVVSKSKSLLGFYSREKLKKIYLWLFQTDRQIKSGLINPGLALLLLTVNLCRKNI